METDHELIGKVGNCTGAIEPGEMGEVMVPIRGGWESFYAYGSDADEAIPAGSQVLDGLIQRRDRPDPATYIGSGKAKQLRDIVHGAGADTVICDGELTPGQLRQLEQIVKVKVVDRTALILDIFAQHARSKEGKAQVERRGVPESAGAARGRRRSRSIVAGSTPGWRSCASRLCTCRLRVRSSVPGGAVARCRAWCWPGTRMPANRPCSTDSPAPARNCFSPTSKLNSPSMM